MSKTTIFENEFAVIYFHEADKIIHHQIKKYIFGDNLREVLVKGVEAMEARGATKWLSNDRENGAMSVEDKAWGDKHWFPRAAAAGWKHWAILPPKKAVGQMSLNQKAAQGRSGGLEVRVFEDEDSALAWLKSV